MLGGLQTMFAKHALWPKDHDQDQPDPDQYQSQRGEFGGTEPDNVIIEKARAFQQQDNTEGAQQYPCYCRDHR